MADTLDTSSSSQATTLGSMRQNRPNIAEEQQRAERDAIKTLDQDAIAAIQETQNAIQAIAANDQQKALSAIERATGKVNVLLARNPDTALIPVSESVAVFDTAPEDLDSIEDIADAAEAAVVISDFPAARALLYGLMSEIRVRIYNLPLATYPTALTEAARLLGEGNRQDAMTILVAALNTLVAVDQVTPLPLLFAREAIREAESLRDKDKEGARRILGMAQDELDRALALGYAGKDPDYQKLRDEISQLEKQLKTPEDTTSLFTRLRERLAGLVKRQSDKQHRGQAPSKSETQTKDEKRAA
jgi:hypothetical protein